MAFGRFCVSLPKLNTLLEESGNCVDQIKLAFKEFFRRSVGEPYTGKGIDLIGKHEDFLVRKVVDGYSFGNVSA